VRREALERLGERPEQFSFLIDLASDRNENTQLRRDAIEAVSENDRSVDIATLKRLLASANQVELREAVIEAVSESADRPAAIGLLLDIARTDNNQETRMKAISALGDMEDERVVTALVQLYDSSSHEETKREILDALAEDSSARSLEKIMVVAQRDPSVRLRKRAIELLADSDDPVALKFLEKLIK